MNYPRTLRLEYGKSVQVVCVVGRELTVGLQRYKVLAIQLQQIVIVMFSCIDLETAQGNGLVSCEMHVGDSHHE